MDSQSPRQTLGKNMTRLLEAERDLRCCVRRLNADISKGRRPPQSLLKKIEVLKQEVREKKEAVSDSRNDG
jgi:hypothetical protein